LAYSKLSRRSRLHVQTRDKLFEVGSTSLLIIANAQLARQFAQPVHIHVPAFGHICYQFGIFNTVCRVGHIIISVGFKPPGRGA